MTATARKFVSVMAAGPMLLSAQFADAGETRFLEKIDILHEEPEASFERILEMIPQHTDHHVINGYQVHRPDFSSCMEAQGQTLKQSMYVGFYGSKTVEVFFGEGPYSGVGLMYSVMDDRMIGIYKGYRRAGDTELYQFPNNGMVFQTVKGTNPSSPDSAPAETDMQAASIDVDYAKGDVYIRYPDRSSIIISLSQGALFARGDIFGGRKTIEFTPANEIINNQVAGLIAKIDQEEERAFMSGKAAPAREPLDVDQESVHALAITVCHETGKMKEIKTPVLGLGAGS